MYNYWRVSITRTSREYQKCPSYTGIRVIQTHFSRRARFYRPKSVRVITESELLVSELSGHTCSTTVFAFMLRCNKTNCVLLHAL